MPKILSVAQAIPPFVIQQNQAAEFARDLFSESFKDIDRLIQAFQNGQIDKRNFVNNLEWFKEGKSFEEKNTAYIDSAVKLGKEALEKCLTNSLYLGKSVAHDEIDAIFFISSTGIATPSIEARIMNLLPFNPHTKRIPIWGLGCAGGASGLSRAFEYCLAFPNAKVLVLSVELCSLTFQPNDLSKSNLIGVSLFADGVACALICGETAFNEGRDRMRPYPNIVATQSTLMPDSLDVMGWELRENGLHVVFSRDIPRIVETWLSQVVGEFLDEQGFELGGIRHFVAHPGGKKVLDAYASSLGIPDSKLEVSANVLKEFGNMSSATIFYVLDQFMQQEITAGELGLCTALGPGFSSELLLLRWE